MWQTEIKPEEREELLKEIMDQVEPFLLAVSIAKPAAEQFIEVFDEYRPLINKFMNILIYEKAKNVALYRNELIENGFTKEEALQIVLNDKGLQLSEILKNVKIKGK